MSYSFYKAFIEIIIRDLPVPAATATRSSQAFTYRATGYSKKSLYEIFSQSPAETGLEIRFPALHEKPDLISGFAASHRQISNDNLNNSFIKQSRFICIYSNFL